MTPDEVLYDMGFRADQYAERSRDPELAPHLRASFARRAAALRSEIGQMRRPFHGYEVAPNPIRYIDG